MTLPYIHACIQTDKHTCVHAHKHTYMPGTSSVSVAYGCSHGTFPSTAIYAHPQACLPTDISRGDLTIYSTMPCRREKLPPTKLPATTEANSSSSISSNHRNSSSAAVAVAAVKYQHVAVASATSSFVCVALPTAVCGESCHGEPRSEAEKLALCLVKQRVRIEFTLPSKQ